MNFFFFTAHLQGPDYRLYKSEPELTTVAEVDESNGEDRSEHPSDREHPGNKGMLIVRPGNAMQDSDHCAVFQWSTKKYTKMTCL